MSKMTPQIRFQGFTDDWEQYNLGELTSWNKGQGLSKDKLTNNGIGEPALHYADLYKFRPVTGYVIHWTNSKEGRPIPNNSILFPASDVTPNGLARTTTLDIPGVKAGGDVIIGQLQQEINAKFLSYQINANSNQILPLITGTTVKHIQSKNLSTLKVTIPNKDEQNVISRLFDNFENLIVLHQCKLELLKKQKKGFLQKMFPKNGAKVPELRFSGFDDDWEDRKLVDVKDSSDKYAYTGGPFGSDLKSSDYTGTGVRIIQLQNIGDGKFINGYKIYTSEEKAKSLDSNLIYPGEIIIAKMADPLARATILPTTESKYLMASDGIRLKVNTHCFNNYFILTLINSDIFRKEALNNSTGTTRKRIGLVTLGNLPMVIPSLKEQSKIGSFFERLDDTIALHQRKLDLLKEQKKGFLQKMFVS